MREPNLFDTCDVCGKKTHLWVVASQLGPVSHAKCDECIRHNAERDSTIEVARSLNFEHKNPRLSLEYITSYKDGEYVPLTATS